MKNYIQEIIDIAIARQPDFNKFSDPNATKKDAAGKRVRQALLEIQKLTKEGRNTIQEHRKENKK